MAILAVMVATVTLLGHRAHTEEILLQTQGYRPVGLLPGEEHAPQQSRGAGEVLTALENTNPQRAEEVRKHFHEEIDKYRDQQKDIQTEAKGLEAEVQNASRRADRFDLGEVFLEIALVVTSITLLTDRRAYWYFGMLLALAGVVCAASAALVH